MVTAMSAKPVKCKGEEALYWLPRLRCLTFCDTEPPAEKFLRLKISDDDDAARNCGNGAIWNAHDGSDYRNGWTIRCRG